MERNCDLWFVVWNRFYIAIQVSTKGPRHWGGGEEIWLRYDAVRNDYGPKADINYFLLLRVCVIYEFDEIRGRSPGLGADAGVIEEPISRHTDPFGPVEG